MRSHPVERANARGEDATLKKKSVKAIEFMNGLHQAVISDPQFRRETAKKTESQIQTEIRPLILRYLEDYFTALGYKDAIAKAHRSFYWEGQEGSFGKTRAPTFGSRNYPDFILKFPYAVAVEYKQSPQRVDGEARNRPVDHAHAVWRL